MGYHAGELAVQRRTGEAEQAQKLLRGVREEIPQAAADFLEEQPLLFTATVEDGHVWAGVMHGRPGFARAENSRTIVVDGADFDGPVGLLALDPTTRSRMRANGTGHGARVHTQQVYANCPKYIQRRALVAVGKPAPMRTERRALSPADHATITAADTLVIASAGPDGLDASHRGGEPGFVRAEGNRLWFPDYQGNTMYMTLGNLVADGRAGLLFLDWETGDTLQLSGRASIEWEPRGVAFDLERVVHTRAAVPLRWSLLERSRFNPPLPSPHVPQHPDAPQLRTARHT